MRAIAFWGFVLGFPTQDGNCDFHYCGTGGGFSCVVGLHMQPGKSLARHGAWLCWHSLAKRRCR